MYEKVLRLSQSTPVHVVSFGLFFVLYVGYLPPRLPTSCLTMAPRFDTLARSEALSRRPLLEINRAGKIQEDTYIHSHVLILSHYMEDCNVHSIFNLMSVCFLDGNSRPQTAPTDIKKDDKYPTESEETDEGRRKGSKSPRYLLWVFYPQEHKQRIY